MKGRKSFFVSIGLLLVCTIGVLAETDLRNKGAWTATTKPRIVADYGKLPLYFEANRGQTDSEVKFLSQGRGYTLFLTLREAVLSLHNPKEGRKSVNSAVASDAHLAESTVVRFQLLGGTKEPRVTGRDEFPSKSNYFLGKDPRKWLTRVPHYAKVKYEDVYPGIDLVYYGTHRRQLEWDFVIAPGADPRSIRLGIEGAGKMTLDAEGTLLMHTEGGDITLQAPLIYQEFNGSRSAVDGSYRLLAENRVTFTVGNYDTGKPLIIDPVLSYSSYLGGSGADSGTHIAVDATGSVYVTGITNSTDFPTLNPFQATFGGGSSDIFVTKLSPDGSALVYSTYLGGSNNEFSGGGIVVDDSGSAYLTGTTSSTDFPTKNPPQGSLSGLQDAFVTKLSADGSALAYSTYLGGSGSAENGRDIAVDTSGNAYVTGFTDSADFPTLNEFQVSLGGGLDAFITKLNANGSGLVYSTYLGGSGDDDGEGIAVDTSGNAYVTGITDSTVFPTLTPPQGSLNGIQDAFVTKLNANGSSLVYSTYLGGSGPDRGHGIAVDASGNAYVTGQVGSNDFPTENPVQVSFGGGSWDAFVTKLNSNGTALEFSTYLGGSNDETGIENISIAVDGSGSAYVTGTTRSTDFPTANAIQASLAGSCDAFVSRLSIDGSVLAFSTYLGGSSCEFGESIAVDDSGAAYVTGTTPSVDFPTMNPLQGSLNGGSDAFLAKFSTNFSIAAAVDSPTTVTISAGEMVTYNLVLSPDGFAGTVGLTCTGVPTGAICFVLPSSVALDGVNDELVYVEVMTTARSIVLPPAAPLSGLPWLRVLSIFLIVASLVEAARRRRAWVGLATAVIVVALWTSCDNDSRGGSTDTETPAGTSTLTVTATSGGLSHTINLTLNVN